MNLDSALVISPRDNISSLKPSRITVIYNRVTQLSYGANEDLLADEDTVFTAREVANALGEIGFKVNLFELNEDTVNNLLEIDTDLIFNLCYGIGSIPKTESEVVRILETMKIPFTGAGSSAILLTNDKLATKKKFIENGIPTPGFQVFASSENKVNPDLHYPLIVKPINEDCSLGITNDSVVLNEKDLKRRIKYLIDKYKEPVLVEEYIAGRELNITVFGNNSHAKVLPFSEITFGHFYDNSKHWKIVDFEAKWKTESPSFKETVGICPARVDEAVKSQITEYAKKVYECCGCRDYARVDIRLSEANIPYFLEINLNPGIGMNDGAIRSALHAGYTYGTFLKEIVKTTYNRFKS